MPTWFGDDLVFGHQGWKTVSVTPYQTRVSLSVLAAYIATFIVATDHIRSGKDIRRMLSFVAVAATGMAVFGIVQQLTSNGRFCWVYAHPTRDTFGAACGAFANQNHFAHFISLGVGPLAWMLWESYRKHSQRSEKASPLYTATLGTALACVVLAALLSLSRGGAAMVMLAFLSFLGLTCLQKIDRGWILCAGAVVLLCFSALLINGFDRVEKELSNLDLLDPVETTNNRHEIWATVLRASGSFYRFGSGAGSHREVYPLYLRSTPSVEYTHAESSYLQILLETGVIGCALVVVAVGSLVVRSVKVLASGDTSTLSMASAVIPGIIVSCVHSTVDFVWHIPSCMTVAILLVAVLTKLPGKDSFRDIVADLIRRVSQSVASMRAKNVSRRSRRTWRRRRTTPRSLRTDDPRPDPVLAEGFVRVPISRPTWLCAFLMFVAIGFHTFQCLRPHAAASQHWDNYLTLSLAGKGFRGRGRLRDYTANHEDQKNDTLSEMRTELLEVLRHCPDHPRAHARLASIYLQEFDIAQQSAENPMGISQIRDAVYASNFASRSEMRTWLQRAIGKNALQLDRSLTHANFAARLCPVQGSAYLYLCELSFLNDPTSDTTGLFLRQAHVLRPMDGSVLLALGQDSALRGEMDAAIRYWREAFHLGQDERRRILNIVAPLLPVEVMLDEFEPDTEGLRELFEIYRNNQDLESARLVAYRFGELIEVSTGDSYDMAEQAMRVGAMFQRVGDRDSACRFFEKAHQHAPQDFRYRLTLGKNLVAAERFADAVPHLQWCKRYKPDDTHIDKVLRLAIRGSFQHQKR